MDTAFARARKKLPPTGKVRVKIVEGVYLTVFHYQHTLLVYDLVRRRPLMTWSEKPTDRRILRAALANLAASHGDGVR